MTDESVALIVGQVATLIGAGITAWVSVRNGQKADRAAVKTEQIHVLVNSTNAVQTAKIAALEAQVQQLMTAAGAADKAAAMAALAAVEKAAAVAAAASRSVPVERVE